VAAIEAVQAALEGGEAAAKTVEPDFRSTGDIAFSSGTGTYTDYDRQYFSFKQYYKDREERYFTFWQKYDNDHSFINLRRWEFGMAQEFPDFYGGELNLSEEYSEYRDADDRRNNRHEVALTMDYERWFNAERSLVDAAWRYKTKNFSIESPRSYIRHFAEVYGLHELSERVTTDAFWRFSDYHYSQGDVLGHNVTNLGLGFQFAPDSVWLWGLNYVSTEKSYDVQKASAFFENEYRVWTRYQPNVDEYGEGEIRLRDRDRRRSVVNDYDEARLKLRYWRQLNPELDGDFRLEWMEKDYSGANPASYDYWRWQTVFNYYPDYHTRWYYNFDYYDYDYSGLTRSYDRMYHRLGLNYNWECGAALTTELALTDQSYSANTGRDYIIWDFLADLYYPVERYQSVRLYFDWSRLDQSFANSVNDFKAVGWGAEYDWRLTPHYRLILSYDYDLRDYERQPRIKDQVLEARLRFDF